MWVARAAVPYPSSFLALCLCLAFCLSLVVVVAVVETMAVLVDLHFPVTVVVVMVLLVDLLFPAVVAVPVEAAEAGEVLLVADLLLQDLRLVADPLLSRRRSWWHLW